LDLHSKRLVGWPHVELATELVVCGSTGPAITKPMMSPTGILGDEPAAARWSKVAEDLGYRSTTGSISSARWEPGWWRCQ
jgi:hypothetical protein